MSDQRIRRVILPGTSSKHFDTLIDGLLSAFHVVFTDAEVVLICNVANSPYAWLPRLFGKPTVLNVDGLDRLRGKWNWLAQMFLHSASSCPSSLPLASSPMPPCLRSSLVKTLALNAEQ